MRFCVAIPSIQQSHRLLYRNLQRGLRMACVTALTASALTACGSDNQQPDNGIPQPVNEDTGNSPGDPLPTQPGPLTLAPLPNPPLTPAPGAASEPLQASNDISTITDFPFLIEPPQDIQDTTGVLTDEDFAQGPLPPVILNPTSINPSINQPPLFANLENPIGFAGQQLEVLFKPVDAEGELPGMFPGSKPEGAQFRDNRDGTKSLLWTPLQPDVGIHEFTVTAVDPAEPMYRTQQTIRIKIQLPDDQSTIENKPPQVNRIRLHTVSVNDPVVLYIRVTDPNGTLPALEVLNLPAGATLTPHYNQKDVSILHWVPQSTGTVFVRMRAIDAIDPSLTGEQTVTIDVLPGDVFLRPGARLKEQANRRDFQIGFAALRNFFERPDGALYARTAAQEFTVVTPENSMKWDYINPVPGKFRWAAADNLINYAKFNQLRVHGHTLVWHRQLPKWVQLSEPGQREIMMREFIDRVMQRYVNDIELWHVVNEALEDDGTFRPSVWFQAMDANYIEIAFRQARLSAPDTKLIYNDYDIAFDGPKSQAMLRLMQSLKDRNVPVDGVGFQLHIFADFDAWDEVEDNFQKVADMDLDIYMTEIDISMTEEHTLAQQAQAYERLLSICLAQPRCKSMQVWGFTDQYSWRSQFDPLLLDDRYQIKPAYTAVQRRLSDN